jgi:uncharacterized protein YndB with AHSA1/START domain
MDEVSVHVDAPPERVWDLVTDLPNMGRFSPENTGGRWLGGASGPAVGARFRGWNRHGFVRWFTHSRVTAAEPPRHFEFEVRESGMRWGYRLEPEGGGTRLTEYREQARGVSPLVRLVQRSGLIGRDREDLMVDGMRETLERVKAAAEL